MNITRDISTLRNWSENPRAIKADKFEELKKRIKRFGQFKPLIVTDDGEVLGGNMRLRAYKELGIKDIWVSVVSPKSEAEKVEIALTDNEELGYYESQELAELIEKFKDDIDLTKYSVHLSQPLSLKDILGQYGPEPEEDEVPDLDAVNPPKSVQGQIYQLGRHRLSCGDSTSLDVMTALMDGKQATMTFTDPPYNVDYGKPTKKNKSDRSILNDNFEDNDAFYVFLRDTIASMKPFVTGDVYICMSSSELHTLQKAFVACGGHWSTFIIWVKNTFTIGRSNYQRQYEPILYGWFDKSTHYWSGTRKLSDVYKDEILEIDNERYIKLEAGVETDVWDYDKPTRSVEHPTMKPIKLCARAIRNSSALDDCVLDQFGGSGSTLIACEQTGRTCYMNELDPRYCDVIRKRYWKIVHNGDETGWEENTPSITGK